MKMKQEEFFAYDWVTIDPENADDGLVIDIYGFVKKNGETKNVCVHITDFTPYCYIELPYNINWDKVKAQLFEDKLRKLLGSNSTLQKCELKMKKKLYYANFTKDKKPIHFPFLLCTFKTFKEVKFLKYTLKNSIYVSTLGKVVVKIHEDNATPNLQLMCCKDLPSTGWMKGMVDIIPEEEMTTSCDFEYICNFRTLEKVDNNILANPLIMGFDIEVYSSNPGKMPNPQKPEDKIFQISCVFNREGSSDYEKYLLSLGEPSPKYVGKDVNIWGYENEAELLIGFTNIIRKLNPNLITGYNILGFDVPYMIDRAKLLLCISEFDRLGFPIYKHAKEKTIKWSSSAYKTQEFQFLNAEGRIFVDLLPIIRRDYKLNNYKLKTVSEHFLEDDTKDPLTVSGIFKCYEVGTKARPDGTYSQKAIKAISLCGKYCVKDTELCNKLMGKLDIWTGLAEMAKVCNVNIFSLYTQGQQVKVFSQVYYYCMYNNIIVEKDGYITKENERYVGAHVFDPIPGVYDRIVPFDFASLYPTTMIAYNIDYSTLVDDTVDNHIKDEDCHVMSFSDHINCIHDPKIIRKMEIDACIDEEKKKIAKLRIKRDSLKGENSKEKKQKIQSQIDEITLAYKPLQEERTDIMKSKSKNMMCEKRYYRFLKEPKGVIPTVLEDLLNARKNTRLQIKKNIEIIKHSTDKKQVKDLVLLNRVLQQRQLSYKVSCNSMYGAMGVRRGYLPFMPGAMCTTYMGRVNIEKVAEVIPREFGGKLIYGDTDCLKGKSPLIILDTKTNKIDYKTVEEISDGNWERINPNKELSKPLDGYKVWSDDGFTEIVNVVRCGVNKPLSRVLTHIGEVICSNEHSLLTEDLECVKPTDVNIGDKLCVSELPLPKDTPNTPIYNNNLTREKIENYEIPDVEFEGLSANLAFVWGVFFADGSCGSYKRNDGNYIQHTWAITKGDNKLLERCKEILEEYEPSVEFKILDTMKSSKANKLIPNQKSRKKEDRGCKKLLVEKYRKLFYNDKDKKIPQAIFNAPLKIRQSFFMGYYAGDGSKKDPALCLSNKGMIGSAGLFYLLRSIGYQVSINTRKDKLDVYKLTGSTPDKKFRRDPNSVKKITPIEDNEGYIYDIQTVNHHFAAGVGQLVVHNSNYIQFAHMEDPKEIWNYAENVAEQVSCMFPKPIKLEFEEAIYWRFLILTKKRYMYTTWKDGKFKDGVGKKGVLLARRDNSPFIRNIYEKTVDMIFNYKEKDEVIYYIITELNKLFSGYFGADDFVITKSVGDTNNMFAEPFYDDKGEKKIKMGDYTLPFLPEQIEEREKQFINKDVNTEEEYYLKCLPAQVQLAEKMKRRGTRVDTGTRLEYIILDTGNIKDKQYVKIEDVEYYKTHKNILRIDYLYYLKLLSNPMDQVIQTAFKEKNFMTTHYKIRMNKDKVLKEFRELLEPKIIFD